MESMATTDTQIRGSLDIVFIEEYKEARGT